MNPPPAEPFRTQAEALGAWLGSSGGRIPDRRSADVHARQLGTWRDRQVNRLHLGTLSPEHEQYLDAVASGWRPRRRRGTDGFRARADELGRWMRATGRVPSASSADADERRLGHWRYHQQARGLAPEREEYLDAVAPGWRPARSGPDVFRARADELGRWFRTTGRVPSVDSSDVHEQQLARWRYNRLAEMRAGTLLPEREEYLDTAVPGWRPNPPGLSDAFRARAEELGRWMRTTSRSPSRGGADAHERALASWRHDQHGHLSAGTLPPERRDYLDQVAPGWRPAPRRGFRAQAGELGRWMRMAGRAPAQRSADPCEQRLGSWRYRQGVRLRDGTLQPEHEQYLDAVAPGWRPPGDEEFRARAEALGRWLVSAGGAFPSAASVDPYEMRLGRFRGDQVRCLRDQTLRPEREQYLDQVAPGWRPRRLHGPEGFRAWAEALGAWMADRGAPPSHHSADPREQRLGAWRQRQSRALRDGTLPPEHREHLDQVAPGWRPMPRKVVGFPAQARAVAQWMAWADGKVPNPRSDDWYERRLDRWRRKWLLQLRTGTLPSERERYLDEVTPGWRPRARSGVDEFPARAQAVGRWLALADGRIPSRRSDDPHERRLGRWRQGWVFHLRNGTLPQERERYLDEVAPGWRSRPTSQRAADQAAQPAGRTRQPEHTKGVRR